MFTMLILVLLLDHPRHTMREFASRTMPVCAETVPMLLRIEADSRHAEPAQRARLLLGVYFSRNADALSKHVDLTEFGGKWPWLWREQSFGCEDGPWDNDLAHFLDIAMLTVKHAYPDYPQFREATRLYVRGLIAARRPWLPFLREMMDEEIKWKLAKSPR